MAGGGGAGIQSARWGTSPLVDNLQQAKRDIKAGQRSLVS